MNIDSIFKPEEIEALTGNPLQVKAIEIKQRFDLRRSYFLSLRNSIQQFEKWMELNELILSFEKSFNQIWNQKWAQYQRNPNSQTLIQYFNEGKAMFQQFEDDLDALSLQAYTHSDEVETLKKDVINKIDNDFISMKSEIIEKIESGINDVLNLKAELGLHQNFSENLKSVKGKINTARFCFLGGFIFSLLLIVFTVFLTYNLSYIKELEFLEKVVMRVVLSLILGFLSYFLFHQYKLYQLLYLKYTHLNNFLGGGATYINQIIGQDGELKKQTNQKLAEMFMEIDETLGIVRKMEHPGEKSVKKTNDILSNVLEKLAEITKNISEIKK